MVPSAKKVPDPCIIATHYNTTTMFVRRIKFTIMPESVYDWKTRLWNLKKMSSYPELFQRRQKKYLALRPCGLWAFFQNPLFRNPTPESQPQKDLLDMYTSKQTACIAGKSAAWRNRTETLTVAKNYKPHPFTPKGENNIQLK